MTLEEYSNLVEKAFGIKNWNYSKKNNEDKTIFTINFSEDGREHTRCKVFVHKSGICDMEAAFPFTCPEDNRVELSYILAEYNFSKRYATLRLELSDGEIINSYSFDMFPAMTPEFVLGKFMGVKNIEKEIYATVVETCKPQYQEEKKSTGVSSLSDKKNKFKIDL
ncbi:MAG: hypothetical protein GX285_10665 [Clostridiales bacterium]|nr:hypothetical protein [Clostridiales bacterium]